MKRFIFTALVLATAVAAALFVSLSGNSATAGKYAAGDWTGWSWHSGDTVSATLLLPSVISPSGTEGVAFWAGFGDGPGIEQTGFTANVVDGVLSYSNWYEEWPADPISYGGESYAGNTVVMTVTHLSTRCYELGIQNVTRGWSASVEDCTTYTTPEPAEVVAEDYGLTVPHFRNAVFTNLSGGTSGTYESFDQISNTSVSSISGSSFTISHS